MFIIAGGHRVKHRRRGVVGHQMVDRDGDMGEQRRIGAASDSQTAQPSWPQDRRWAHGGEGPLTRFDTVVDDAM